MIPFHHSFGYIQPRLEQISNETILHYIRPTQELMDRFDSYFDSGEYSRIESEYVDFLKSYGKFEFSI